MDPITLYILQEAYIKSDKTISIDLDKFINGETDKLLIAGLSGGGKSTLCKHLARQYNAECFETDHCASWLDLVSKYGASKSPKAILPKEVFQDGYYNCIIPRMKKNKRQIVEGGLLWQGYVLLPETRKELNKYPVIIFGVSSLKASLRLIKRRLDRGKTVTLRNLWKIYLRNFVQLKGLLNTFKSERLKAGGNIKNFEVPKL